MYRRIERPNGNIIEIQDFYVLKKVPVSTHEFEEKYVYLKTLYATMLRENVPHVIELSEISPSTKAPDQKQYIALKLKPCGLQIIPNSLNSLISALRCIFQALEAIHRLGYAHRDVRWPNILCVADEDWRLIDFENSSLGDSTLQKKDLHMVGDMMSQCISIFTSSNLLCSLHNQLRTQSPPNASEALRILNDIRLDVNIE
jgi:serine/threonine protein kinase